MSIKSKKNLILPIFFITLIIVNSFFTFTVKQDFNSLTAKNKYHYKYIGVQKCIECHGNNTLGDQVKLWESDPHSKAYLTLTIDKSSSKEATLKNKKLTEIMKRSGISNPTKNRKCLRCHTTGGHRQDNTIIEGVGCEGCHGPAEKYVEYGKHAGYQGYQTALKRGMMNIIGTAGIKTRQMLCKRCHNWKKRPCANTNPHKAMKSDLTMPEITGSFPHKIVK